MADDPTRDFPGLSAEAAGELARARGWDAVRVLEPGAMITMEHREGRLNLVVRDGVVERAWEG